MVEQKIPLQKLVKENEEIIGKVRLYGKKKRAPQLINPEVELIGHTMNPSLNTILRFGGLITLTEEAKKKLERGTETHTVLYDVVIKTRLPDIVRAFTQERNVSFDPFKPERMNIEDLREVLKHQFFNRQNRYNQTTVDDITRNILEGHSDLPAGNYDLSKIEYFTIPGVGLLSYRIKEDDRRESKAKRKVREVLDRGFEEMLYDCLVEMSLTRTNSWDEQEHARLVQKYRILKKIEPLTRKRRYETPITNVFPNDGCGLRLILFNDDKAEKTKKNVLRKRTSAADIGFSIISDRIEDHTKRPYEKEVTKRKPGGVHVGIVAKGAIPVVCELQVYSVVDEIYDKLGPRSHFRYENERS